MYMRRCYMENWIYLQLIFVPSLLLQHHDVLWSSESIERTYSCASEQRILYLIFNFFYVAVNVFSVTILQQKTPKTHALYNLYLSYYVRNNILYIV